MAITRNAPFETELESFPGFRMLQDSLSRMLSEPASRPWTPPVDIYETENEIVLKADVPDWIRRTWPFSGKTVLSP
jgi:HSP20 family protein